MKPRNTSDKKRVRQMSRGNELSDISNLIHDPDHGLYARIRDQQQGIEMLQPLVNENKDEIEQQKKTISKLTTTVNDLVSWKNKMTAAYKWVLVTLAAGSIGVCFKLVYDVLKILVIK